MATKITQRITGFALKKADDTEAVEETPQPVEMNESIARPEFLLGSTYKIKPPISEHALYITINDIILNEDTDHEVRRPYEIFINSKAMEHFQWVIALTRVISAVFRKGGDLSFLIEELRSVYDPNGGYYKKGGVFMPSLVAEIGAIIEKHMTAIGLLEPEGLSPEQQQLIDEKRAQIAAQSDKSVDTSNASNDSFPDSAGMCKKCHTKAAVMMDGCLTCLNCGDSKCG